MNELVAHFLFFVSLSYSIELLHSVMLGEQPSGITMGDPQMGPDDGFEEESMLSGVGQYLTTATSDYFTSQAHHVPLRLTSDERLKLHLLEGALTVSDYTNKVDIVPSGGRCVCFIL
jgi:hypothetical protein